MQRFVRLFCIVFFFAFLVAASFAQTTPAQTTPTQAAPLGALRGQVTDPSGAAISAATVIMTPETGSPIVVQSGGQGNYEFKSLAAGKYTLTVAAEGFTLFENDSVVIAEQALRLNVTMSIAVEEQKVQVSDTAPTIDVNPSSNAGAITISGKELEALPDDPDELLTDLQALAGPSAGPNGGQMYIDGFTAGQLPPKSSIREIRINQNPFSAEYDKLGYGRIEIFTKPGTDKLHGQFMVNGNDSAFNSPNPFAGVEPPYYSVQYNGQIGGALGKHASYFFNIDRRNINEVAAIDAIDPDTGILTASSLYNPRQRTNIAPRFDWAVTKNNTLTVRYQYYRDTETNNGVGGSTLPEQAYYSKSTEDTLQVSDTQIYGSKIVNETRFQYLRDGNGQNPSFTFPSVNVLGNFTSGGSNSGTLNDVQNGFELQNYTSLIQGNHTLKFGARFRDTHDTNFSTSNFNGTFTFPSFTAFQNSAPSQLYIVTGSPNAAVNYLDFEPYAQDDWRVRPNITLSLGLRFETQNVISDHADFAPRLGFAWGVHGRSSPPIVVIRGGYGIFYDRFQLAPILQADRLNGITQQEYVIQNPTCYPGLNQPFTFSLTACTPPNAPPPTSTNYQIASHLHAPYTLQGAVSVERQVTKSATLSVTYLNARGFDQLLTLNADAPYPGTPCYPFCPTVNTYLYRYVSEANFMQNQLIANTNIRVGQKLQLFGYYVLNYVKGDTPGGSSSGVSGFPSNSYDIRQDYGRTSYDVRNRLFLGGSIALPYLFRLSPFMIVNSGSPINIVSPYDLNGDGSFNDRPGLVSTTTCPLSQLTGSYIYCTPFGTFDASGATGKLLPINYATGPNHFTMNLRLSKTFGFGPKIKAAGGNQNQGQGGPGGGGPRGGGGRGGPLFGGGPTMMSASSDRRYNLTLSVSARDAFNNVNAANPNSTLGSNTFGVSTGLQGGPFSQGSAATRKIELQATFAF